MVAFILTTHSINIVVKSASVEILIAYSTPFTPDKRHQRPAIQREEDSPSAGTAYDSCKSVFQGSLCKPWSQKMPGVGLEVGSTQAPSTQLCRTPDGAVAHKEVYGGCCNLESSLGLSNLCWEPLQIPEHPRDQEGLKVA